MYGKYNYIAYLLANDNGVSVKVAKYAGKDRVDLIENEAYGFCLLCRYLKLCQNTLLKLSFHFLKKKRKKISPVAIIMAIKIKSYYCKKRNQILRQWD